MGFICDVSFQDATVIANVTAHCGVTTEPTELWWSQINIFAHPTSTTTLGHPDTRRPDHVIKDGVLAQLNITMTS